MNYRMLLYLFSIIMLIEAAFLLLSAAVALIYGESVMPFILTVAILIALAAPFARRPSNTKIYAKEGFVCSAGAWIILSAFGALPFLFSGVIPNYIEAVFETVSGFTTTGSTVLSAVEHLPKGILFWRSLTHWVGGMGVLVFMLAILPSAGGNSIHLMRAEVPGPTKDKVVPKMRTTALVLYGIYAVLTVIMVVCLLFTGMPLYDSVVNSLATAGTGGFSVKNISIAAYNNPAAEWIISVFMVIFGVNFNLYYLALIGKARAFFKSEEFRVYIGLIVVAVTAVAVNTWNLFEAAGDCIRAAFFQVSSIISTTGYSTVDFNLWPSFSKAVIILVMITGACAGSTAGGLKLSRVLIIFKNILKELKHMIRPNSVNTVKLDGESVRDETTKSAANYLCAYFIIVCLSVVLVSVDGFSFETSASAVLTCINNVGPGFDNVGPLGNFGEFSDFSTIVLTLNMLLGRLEIIPILILFSPRTWRKR